MKQLSIALEELVSRSKQLEKVYQPAFFRLRNPEDRASLSQILSQPGLTVSNELHSQLRELVKSLHPTHKFSSDELDLAAKEHLSNIPEYTYQP